MPIAFLLGCSPIAAYLLGKKTAIENKNLYNKSNAQSYEMGYLQATVNMKKGKTYEECWKIDSLKFYKDFINQEGK